MLADLILSNFAVNSVLGMADTALQINLYVKAKLIHRVYSISIHNSYNILLQICAQHS